MINKNLIYIGLALVVLVLAMVAFSKVNATGNVVQNVDEKNSQELNKYRSDSIPEDCRLPKYEDNIESWKQHLSHHQETLYCLDYYEN